MDDLVYFYPEGHSAHQSRGHPERPERIDAIQAGLESLGWWSEFPKVLPMNVSQDLLLKVHNQKYLTELQSCCQNGEWLDMDTYTTPSSWKLALRSAGGAVAIAETVWLGKARRGFGLTRPPGHHANSRRGKGFCLLNNIAIACQYLLFFTQARKLAVIDLDVHHGNGTQDIFWNRSDVFFHSIHQYPLFPNTGWIDERGEGEGYQMTANIPLPPGSGDQAYQASLENVCLPLLDRYKPEMILVSFGSDTHWCEPLAQLLLSAEGIRRIITGLTEWADRNCQGKIVVILEGGYDLEASKVCSQAVVAALLALKWKDSLGNSPQRENHLWENNIALIKELWDIK